MNHWTQVGHTLLYAVVYNLFDCLTYTDACIYINIVKISEDGSETEIDIWRLEVKRGLYVATEKHRSSLDL